MFTIFKKNRHKHVLDRVIDSYYKLYHTPYRNSFDEVCIYVRKQCSCGYYKDIEISRNSFSPSLYYSAIDEIDFIDNIKRKGVEEEYEINLRTGMPSNRLFVLIKELFY
jgi:hypothetical protein